MAARCGTGCFRIYRWWTMKVRCGCIRVCRVGFGPRPRGNTDGMSRAVRAVAAAAASTLGAVVVRDLFQRKHALLRNFPLIGHARYLVEAVGPELRQYIVAANNEERPFTRDQRRWVYTSAKKENNYFGFGTDNDVEYTAGYPVIKHRTFGRAVPPSAPMAAHEVDLPCAKVIGAARGRPGAFRPKSVVNISAMSFGSLSGSAVEALNRGAVLADCLHNTGEGGISRYHRHGGELIFQIGTAYFGCRDAEGRFDLDRLKDVVAGAPVRALEIKLSQGAKPSLGGLLPARQGVRRDRGRSRRSARGATASARRGTPSSPTPTACWTGWNCSPPRRVCRWESSRRSVISSSGTSSPI